MINSDDSKPFKVSTNSNYQPFKVTLPQNKNTSRLFSQWDYELSDSDTKNTDDSSLPTQRSINDIRAYLEKASTIYTDNTHKSCRIIESNTGKKTPDQLCDSQNHPLLTAEKNSTHVHRALIEDSMDIDAKAEMILASLGLYLDNPHADFNQNITFDPKIPNNPLQTAIIEVFERLKQQKKSNGGDSDGVLRVTVKKQ